MDRDSEGIRLPFYRRRISLFLLIFSAFFITVFISSSSQLVLFKISVSKSLDRWKVDRELRLEREVRNFLRKGDNPRTHEMLIIFNKDKEVVFTNRMRHIMMPKNIKPVKDRSGNIIGYMSSRQMGFRGLEENNILLESLLHNLLYSSAVSLFISLIISYIISKKISKSSIDIQKALKSLERGDTLELKPSGAREIVDIGIGVNNLSKKLSAERILRNQWLHDISHDLKTPVSALKVQFEGMLDGLLPLNRERILQNSSEIDRLDSLIKGLDDLMTIESPDINIQKKSFSIGSLINELKKSFSDRFELEGKILNVKYESGTILGDYSLLFKALSNLLDNSLLYSFDNSVIKLTAGINNNNVILAVENLGEGISENDLKHIFDRLYRGDSSRNSYGSGLGLSIVKAIIDKHKGTIEVSSINGITRFSINLSLKY